MALGKAVSAGECELRLRPIHSFGRRKRVLVRINSSSDDASSTGITMEDYLLGFDCDSTKRRRCGDEEEVKVASSLVEVLPLELLIKIVCGVDHGDLKQLFHVSKAMRDATIIAKECHFAYSTPRKIKLSDADICEIDSNRPNAPVQRRRVLDRLDEKKLADVTKRLF
ncbi:hypothetical protein Droror1_Dr00020794 [Drosera rotundifolia]